ncbi:DUF6036 family nucleotidyltransferase [Hydrogenobacter hydrogenophilus]|uniref:DUF6036 domain-containing protein n=1 Tax=Hydrogenobacter hydrogenophilus TaxID=35835 RepID=A0A285P1E0_9AQUI|nr:DUF6036 family nucleotidyltransferase [Hydrogenobacter hydrogenophilus]SNZ15540.1 hypothetical protein SAMN06265353_1396 [Hydrogenobacter hydrogenophilus]
MNRKEVEAKLKAITEEINEELRKRNLDLKIFLILVGSASLIVKYHLKRGTKDIDVILRPYLGGIGDLLTRRGFQVVSEALVNLHPDYEDRLELVLAEGQVFVLTLSPYDLAISKISRGFDKDINDVLESDLIKQIDFNKLKELYFEAMSYWIGNEKRYRFSWEVFEDAYLRKFGQTFDEGRGFDKSP